MLGRQVYGVIGSPVAHSRSPALHNAALAAGGVDAVYLPLLVDDLPRFLAAFGDRDFRGFSVTLPHKVPAAAAACCCAGLRCTPGVQLADGRKC